MQMLDIINWEENFDFNMLRSLGTEPLVALAEIACLFNGEQTAEEMRDHWNLCQILHDQIIKLDETIQRLEEERWKNKQRKNNIVDLH